MPRPERGYVFRPLEPADLALVGRWLAAPHAAKWWGEDAQAALGEIREAIDSVETEPLIVELGKKPFAYLQSYDPHLEDGHPYADQPFGTLGLDLAIGPPEMLGQGHGPALLRQFADELFAEGVPRLLVDPHPDNARAIRAFGKAGFLAFGLRRSVHGDALLMLRDNPEFAEDAA